MQVRRVLHKMGYRFRLHRKDLPGKPDMVPAEIENGDSCTRLLLAWPHLWRRPCPENQS